MDKYEYKIRAEEIRNLISQGNYQQAAEVADTIDWSRVKKPAILCTISDLYKKNRRYDDAIDLLLLAYEKYPDSKDIIYSLSELYIKTNSIMEAVAYYKKFAKIATNDSRKYILQYKIYEMQDISLDERIEVLEELKARDYRDKWGYALAYLYHRVGLATKCVEECDELIAWFEEGKYVYMAMELKMRHQPLTEEQQAKYNQRLGQGEYRMPVSEIANENQVIDKILTDGYDNNKSYVAEESQDGNVPVSDAERAGLAGQTIVYNPVQDRDNAGAMVPNGSTMVVSGNKGDVSGTDALALSLGYTQVYHGIQPEPEIVVKPIELGEYNTMNLQQAIAEGVAEVLEKNGESSIENVIKADTKEIYPPNNAVSTPVSSENSPLVNENVKYVPQSITDKTVVIAQVSGTFDATRTIPLYDVQRAVNAAEGGNTAAIPAPEAPAERPAPVDVVARASQNRGISEIDRIVLPDSNFGANRVVYPENAPTYADYISSEIASSPEAIAAMSAQPPENLAGVMTQEPDGQLSLVMPTDRVKLVTQITGQMSINDVMAEWNRMKYEREELNRQRYHEIVKRQTGEIFNEFEKAALNGVLETLERESAEAARIKAEEEKAEEERVKEERVKVETAMPTQQEKPVQKLAFEHVDMSNAEEGLETGEGIDAENYIAEEYTEDSYPEDNYAEGNYSEENGSADSVVEGVTAGVIAGVAAGTAGAVASAAVETAGTVASAAVETAGAVASAAVETAGTVASAAEAVADEKEVLTSDDVVEELEEIQEVSVDFEENSSVEEAEAEEAEVEEVESEEVVSEETEISEAETIEETIEETKEVSFEENLSSVFDNIAEEENDENEDNEDFSAFFRNNKIVGSDETEYSENGYSEDGTGEEVVKEVTEEISEEVSEEVTEEVSEVVSEEVDDETDDDDPRNKTYHAIGLNDTTELYISKIQKKKAEKEEAEKNSSEEVVEEDDATRELTPEEMELFGPYIQSKGSRGQLINVIDNVSMASYTGNIILTGNDIIDVANLATNIMRDIKQTDSNFSGKMAKIPADKLNTKQMDTIMKKLVNGALIIEEASVMTDATASSLCKCLDQENFGIIVTMLDSERNMDKLLSRVPRLSPLFTSRMNIKPLTKEQLAEYAVKYAYEKEFSIDHMGMLALHSRIDEKQTSKHSVNILEVREIVDAAIAHVKKKNIAHFFDILGGKRYDDEDMIILGEKDFK